jgi:hypothetical protein
MLFWRLRHIDDSQDASAPRLLSGTRRSHDLQSFSGYLHRPGNATAKGLYPLQLISAHRQKSQSPPPPIGGRVVWTFQLCAYKATIHNMCYRT